MIYFVNMIASGRIKIGTTRCVKSRMTTLKAEFGPVQLLGQAPGGREREKEIHDQFSHIRFSGTEFFKPEPELIDFVKALDPSPVDTEKTTQRLTIYISRPLFMRVMNRAVTGMTASAFAEKAFNAMFDASDNPLAS